MTIQIEENDFNPGEQYSDETVAQMLETIKPNLKNNVFLLNTMEAGGLNTYSCANVGSYNQNTLPMYLNQPKILDKSGKEPKEYTVAGVINLHNSHYVSAIFRKTEDNTKTLVLYDPIGESGKFADGFSKYEKDIADSFKQKFGNDIVVEVNPKNHALYQKDSTSCGPVSIHTLEHVLHDKNFEENAKIGLTKNQNGEFKFEESAISLRQEQYQKLKEFKMIDDFMKDKEHISSAQLVDNIFNDKNYDEKTKNTLLNKLMDSRLIEGQENLSKTDILKTLDSNKKQKTTSRENLPEYPSKNFTPDSTPSLSNKGPRKNAQRGL